MLVDEQ